MLTLAVEVVAVVAAIVVLLFHGAAVLLAAQMPRLEPAAPPPPGRRYPSMSVIIAARNEEADLPGCLDDLLAQDYPDLDIVVVDGASSDRTREIAAARAPRVRLLEEPPLPPGWVGKNWGCATGAKAARGSWLLFTDADVRYHPSAVRTTYEWAERERAQLTTLAPRVATGSFWERVVMPFYIQMVLTYFRAPRTNRDGSRSAMANGQYWLTERSTYDALGGHTAVRGYVLEDVRIAQRYRAAGLRIRLGWAPELLTTRMYRNRHEMAEGLLKNIHGIRFSFPRQIGFAVALVGLFWLPLGLLPLGVLAGSAPLAAMGTVLAGALFAKHVGFARATGTPAAYGLLYPAAVAFYLGLLLRSFGTGGRGTVVWKGRSYRVDPDPPSRNG